MTTKKRELIQANKLVLLININDIFLKIKKNTYSFQTKQNLTSSYIAYYILKQTYNEKNHKNPE